jgi:N12 class adenine-specific DNA methylase
MPRKDEFLSQLLSSKTQEIVSSPGKYTAFLQTAAQNYKYGFQEQVLIHAQRPDATACAEIGVWNRLGRWVNRGATGIALLRSPNLPYRIRYVFDVSDTNSRENREISLWQMKPAYENEVIRTLQDKFLLDSNNYWGEVVEALSQQLAEEAAGDYLPDLLNNKQDSFLEELDDGSVARWFKESVRESVRYMVLHRCGYAPELDNDVFGRIQDFNTEITASLLGSAVSTLSESILREIGVTVKSLERRQSRTFDSFGDTVYNEARKNEMERSQNNGTDLHNAGGLPAAQPDTPRESQGRQVRNASPQLPPQAPGGAIYRDADEGHSERPSGGGGPGGQPDAGTADQPDGPGAGRNGGTESSESDAVGTEDEQHPADRGGTDFPGPDLHVIEESPLPSVEEQISFLDGGFSVSEAAQQTFFPQLQLPQQIIDEALCMGFNDRDSRKIICAYFMKDKPDNAAFLQESYGTNGAGLIIQGQEYAVWYDPEGIRISTGRTVKKLHTTLVTWEQAAKRIRELLDMGRYMPQAELDQVPDFERRRLAQALAFAVRECSAQAKEAGYLPLTAKTYSSNSGFPEIEAQMQRLLESPDTLMQLVEEWTVFASAHANDRSLMVSRLYNPAKLLQKLEDLQRTPLIFTAAQGFDPLRRYFISDDEINQALRGHERAFRSRLDVFSFFSQSTDTKAREQFLKRQHGEYSGYHGGNDNKTYTSAGFSFSHGDLTAPYAQVNMKWPAVTKWVSNMISSGIYLYPSDAGKMADYEINQLARRIMSFFSNAPEGFQRPTPRSEFDYWEGVAEIQEQLSDPEQVNTIYQAMMQPLMEATPPDDRFFEARKQGMEAVEGYLAGTFSVFGKGHTLRPPITQVINEDLERAKALISTFCSEEYDSEPDFSDLRKVDIAYTSITDEEVPVQVSVDLVDFRLDRSIDGIIVDSRKYDSLKELTEQELVDPDFDELVAFSEEQLAKVALHGIRDKVVQRFTENGEEIQIQHHVNGFYYNHYNVVNGTAKYVDGPYDTLEEASKEMRGYHPQAVEIDDSAPDVEEDSFDDIDPQQVREELAKSGIVDGKLVDPEALNNTPFIRQVMTDVGAAEPFPTLPTTQRPQNRPHTLHPEISADARRNYHIRTNDLGAGVPIERFYHNVHAIELLHKLESENRLATPDEQDILAEYVGWGGLPQFFEETNAHYAELKALLSEDEYAAARESTLTAFYTPPVVIRAMYKGLSNLGFQTGNILEPSCGVGNFMGLLPENMENSKIYGVELDSISGRIAQQLYQKNSIAVQGFEKTDLPDSFFDVAIGNVPFGTFKVLDKKYDKYNFLIHDYFFARALDKVRPGGVVAFITSKGTMDKENPSVRKYIAQRADLLGAIRLPNDTFKAAAGTEVTSDILFLQKRSGMTDLEPDWVHLGTDEKGLKMNGYFVSHPEMVLGQMQEVSGPYGMETACIALEGKSLEQLLSVAIRNIHGEIQNVDLDDLPTKEADSLPADPSVRNFSFAVVDGKLCFRENSRMIPVSVSATAEQRIRGLIGIRDCVRKLIEYQTEDYPEAMIQEAQVRLNALYDSFAEKYGRINSRANSTAFSSDNAYYLLSSLEVRDSEGNFLRKADMFSKRTIRQKISVTSVDTASEALALSLAEKAKVDMPYMVELTRKSEEEILSDLTGVIFLNPEHDRNEDVAHKYLPADEYLSGNVREKLRTARAFAETDKEYTVNVQSLEAVQPVDLTASEISVRLGAAWLPTEVVRDFTFELLRTPYYQRRNIKVHYSTYTGEWNIDGKSLDRGNVRSENTFGTERINAYKIIEETLNLRDVRIFDYEYDDSGKKVAILNTKQTAIAQEKQEQIKQKFADWIWADPNRRERLTRLYNEKFNSIRPREYDGSHLNFVGINPEITLRPHQVNAIAHILYGGNTLLAHTVGAGKTFEMVAAAQESKRLGLCQKSLFVVPNHLTEQWAAEYLQLYPAANILVATKKDFETKNRKRFCSRIATGDYDAIIIGHSQFEKIPMSQERQKFILEQQKQEILDGIRELKRNNGDNFSVKQLERSRKSIQQRLEKLNDQSRKDDVITFEELGVDRIFVDEAHMFKNLAAFTKMRNVAGISQTEAQKSSDLYMKCRYLDELTGGRGVVFATGTPISNSMVELYTMQKYLQYNTLKENDLLHFDAWASTFGETVTAIELAPEGTGYRAKTRFAKFYNLPELMSMFKEIADIQTADMLKLPVPEAEYHNVVLKPSEQQKEIVASLSERAEKVRNKQVDSNEDNMLVITNDGRKLALDQRLINPMLPDSDTGKVAVCAENVYNIWEGTAAQKSTQMVFVDLSTPHNDGQFNVYDDLKKKLLDKGIPESEIAYIHNAKTEAAKKELFGKVRSGEVRVLIGSTQKMGAGTNAQRKLIALHHVDCPWRPSDLQQREGRIIRQGNENPKVDIYTYVTENTFDSYLYQLVEGKQKFIGQIMTSKSPVRSAEDIDETALSYAEIKALCSGNPHIKEKMDLDIEVQKLKLLRSNHMSQRYALEDQLIRKFPKEIASMHQWIDGLEADMALLKDKTQPNADGFCPMVIGGQTYTEKKAAGTAILDACNALTSADPVPLGSYRGLKLTLCFDSFEKLFKISMQGTLTYKVGLGTDVFGNIQRMDNLLESMPTRQLDYKEKLKNLEIQVEIAKQEVEKPFPREEELKAKSARLDQLNILLNMDKRENEIVDGVQDEGEIQSQRESRGWDR